MKLRCLNEKCGKTFLHSAKLIKTQDVRGSLEMTPSGEPLQETRPYVESLESSVCPYCFSKNIDEFVEPQPEISSLKKAALEEVDGLIAQGYAVHSVFANHAVLVKREEKKSSLKERNECNDKDADTLREDLGEFTESMKEK